jgi:ketosteroid isomerase-like protein
MNRPIVLRFILLLVFADVQVATSQVKSGGAQDIAQFHKQLRRFTAGADATQVAALYHPDARVFVGGAPIVSGRANIQAMWKTFFDKGFTDLKLAPVACDRQGDLIVDLGTYSGVMNGKPEQGKYVLVWKKHGGTWKIWVDAFSN